MLLLKPEIQILDSDSTQFACGSLTVDYGTIENGDTLVKNFQIQNVGTADLTLNSIGLSGANAGEFNIISPITPYVLSPLSVVLVSVEFAPTSVGNKAATVTINNDDSDESACIVFLTAIADTAVGEIEVRDSGNKYFKLWIGVDKLCSRYRGF